MFLTPFWYWPNAGFSKGLVHNLLMQFFIWAAQKCKFSKLVFMIL